jgi:hypothetical protein
VLVEISDDDPNTARIIAVRNTRPEIEAIKQKVEANQPDMRFEIIQETIE